ncbi:MAG TPA: hypothetical protein VJ576_02595 [Rhodocyclaceae bacterium]|nr:hypothetical protein [Rhodocyclaceae bacterium]
MIIDLAGLIEDRLAADQAVAAVVRQIGGAADLEAAELALKNKPATFLLPLAEEPVMPPLAGEFSQRIVIAARIVYAVGSARDLRGDIARGDLVGVRQAVWTSLIGWKPAGCDDGMAYAGGQLLKLAPNKVLWWADDFVTTRMEILP